MENPKSKIQNPKLRRAVLALVLFGVSFGYVEAAVVVYLRALSEPARAAAQHRDDSPALTDLFPLLTPAEIRSAGPFPLWRVLEIEIGREAATMLLLAAIAVAIGRTRTESVAAFVMAFGIWDISFYGFLKIFIHWPVSLLTWDLLFLLPVPWSGPVLAPVIVSFSMIAAGGLVLKRAWDGRPVFLSGVHWAGIFFGGFVIILSFTWGFRNLMAGGLPVGFRWLVFAAGLVCSWAAFFDGFRRNAAVEMAPEPAAVPEASTSPVEEAEAAGRG